jgi:hypothetical protein
VHVGVGVNGEVGWCKLHLAPGHKWDAVELVAPSFAKLKLHPPAAAEDARVYLLQECQPEDAVVSGDVQNIESGGAVAALLLPRTDANWHVCQFAYYFRSFIAHSLYLVLKRHFELLQFRKSLQHPAVKDVNHGAGVNVAPVDRGG